MKKKLDSVYFLVVFSLKKIFSKPSDFCEARVYQFSSLWFRGFSMILERTIVDYVDLK